MLTKLLTFSSDRPTAAGTGLSTALIGSLSVTQKLKKLNILKIIHFCPSYDIFLTS